MIGPEIVIIDPAIDQDQDPEEDQNQEIVEVEEIDTDLVQDQEIAKRARVIDPDQKNRRRNVRGPEVERKKEAGEAEAKKKKGQKIKGNVGINLLGLFFPRMLFDRCTKITEGFITFSSDNGVDSKGGISDNNGDSSLHKKDVDHEAVINDEIRNQSFLPGNNNGESEYEDKGGGKRRSRTKSPSRKRSKSKDRGERRKRSRYKCFGNFPMK